jgi:hypothetical protein
MYYSAMNVMDDISSYIKMVVMYDVITLKTVVEDFLKFEIKTLKIRTFRCYRIQQ